MLDQWRSRAAWLLAFAWWLAMSADSRASYLAYADRLQPYLDATWNSELGAYLPGRGSTFTQVNADLLLVHSVAALRGHTGASRADERARRIARLLTGPEVWSETPLPDGLHVTRGPGWRAAPVNPNMHPVFEVEAAEGLAFAYQARAKLGLDAQTVEAIRAQIAAVATGPDFAWPALRLNQHNWPCAMLAADALVNGRSKSLADGMRRHLDRFLDAAEANFAGGLRFRYLPHKPPTAAINLDSSEYANVVLSFARHYGQARRAGMPRPARLGLLRSWIRRVVAGSWTHGGYLNWDTGLGFARWHQRKKVALAQQALIAVADEPELGPGPEWAAWARWILDRGLQQYVRELEHRGAVPHASAYGVDVVAQSDGAAYLTAARYAANAARALHAGLVAAPASQPPPLYAFDPDTGRLAVTTPAYNTAIVAVNQRAFPYGGLDLARLYDSRQQVAANIGGVGLAAFGLTVRSGETVLRTQYGRRRGRSALRIVRGPAGVDAHLRPGARRAYAGPFASLRVQGATSTRGLRASNAYSFRAGSIDARWTVSGARGRQARSTVTFPSWGKAAKPLAELADGRVVELGKEPLELSRVIRFRVTSENSGYTVTPRSIPQGARAQAVNVVPQDSAPNPGPTASISFKGTASLAVRLAVSPGRAP